MQTENSKVTKAENVQATNPNIEIVAVAFYDASRNFKNFGENLENALEDGDISRNELYTLALDAPGVIAGVKNITSVSKELKSLSKTDLPKMLDSLSLKLGTDVDAAKTIYQAVLAYVSLTFKNAERQIKATKALASKFRKTAS